jgi:hypothetical protein
LTLVLKREVKSRIKVNGGGQECPPHRLPVSRAKLGGAAETI